MAVWIFFLLLLCYIAFGVLVSQPEIECRTLAVKAQSLNHWTSWEFPGSLYLIPGLREYKAYVFLFVFSLNFLFYVEV